MDFGSSIKLQVFLRSRTKSAWGRISQFESQDKLQLALPIRARLLCWGVLCIGKYLMYGVDLTYFLFCLFHNLLFSIIACTYVNIKGFVLLEWFASLHHRFPILCTFHTSKCEYIFYRVHLTSSFLSHAKICIGRQQIWSDIMHMCNCALPS